MTWAHICVDMQRLFADQTAWHTPWLARIVPAVTSLVAAHPGETFFTRFIPPHRADEAHGAWRAYYEHWDSITRDRLGDEMVDLVPELARFVPPATVVDKSVYSPWLEPALDDTLKRRGVETIVVTGGETDVCVLATVLGAVDHGYRVVIAKDALCSSRDETHDALLALYEQRFGAQIKMMTAQEALENWE